ncbi:MAG TPA: GYF domain-containing protein [Luteolibacter sp.]|nr:GYF domain-containing protein [Luteolibacter sp.]
MEQNPQEAWYYSKSGERIGPVSHDELQQIILNGELHPGNDLVWKAGMETWKAVREMRDVFQFPQAATKPAETQPAAATKPVAVTTTKSSTSNIESPRAESEPRDVEDLEWPGARRRVYILVTILLPMLCGAAAPFAEKALTGALGADTTAMIGGGAALLLSILSIVVTFMRLNNLAMSRWWFLGFFVPLLNIWLWYRCFACPAGYASHKKLGKMGVLLAILYWGMWLTIIGTIGAGAYFAKELMKDQEKMGKIRQMIQQAIQPGAGHAPQEPTDTPVAPPAEP